MSKLLDLFDRIGKESQTRLGFPSGPRSDLSPPMLLLALCNSREEARRAARLKPDALLFSNNKPEMQKDLSDTLWGVTIPSPTPRQVKELRRRGGDFVVFNSVETQLDALIETPIGRILLIPSYTSIEQTRMLQAMPIDALILETWPTPPLTFQVLHEIVTIRSQVSGHLMLRLGAAPNQWELECLRDAGINALIFNMDTVPETKLDVLRNDLLQLPRRRPEKAMHTPSLPQLGSESLPSIQPTPSPDDDQDEELED